MSKRSEVGAVLALKALVMIIYTYGVVKGNIRPTFPSWCIFFFAVSLTCYTAFRRGERPTENIGNFADVFLVIFLTFVAGLFGKGENMAWKGIDILSAILAGAILVYWFSRRKEPKTDVKANLAMQGVMCVAFIPLINNLLTAKTNPESLFYWIVVLASESWALHVVWKGGKPLARIYNIRSVTFTLLALALIIRLEFFR